MWYSTNACYDEAEIFYQVYSILTTKHTPQKCTISDPNTGELLFKYWHNNIEYMQGEFAERFFKWAMR